MERAEQYAEGLVGKGTLDKAMAEAEELLDATYRHLNPRELLPEQGQLWFAAEAAKSAADSTTWTPPLCGEVARAAKTAGLAEAFAFTPAASQGPYDLRQAYLLRDIFGNPFRPASVAPAWLTPTVVSLATAAYNERELPSGHLDRGRLAVLSDALEEAGCDDADILGHLRGPGPHVRGCWCVDLLLGRS